MATFHVPPPGPHQQAWEFATKLAEEFKAKVVITVVLTPRRNFTVEFDRRAAHHMFFPDDWRKP